MRYECTDKVTKTDGVYRWYADVDMKNSRFFRRDTIIAVVVFTVLVWGLGIPMIIVAGRSGKINPVSIFLGFLLIYILMAGGTIAYYLVKTRGKNTSKRFGYEMNKTVLMYDQVFGAILPDVWMKKRTPDETDEEFGERYMDARRIALRRGSDNKPGYYRFDDVRKVTVDPKMNALYLRETLINSTLPVHANSYILYNGYIKDTGAEPHETTIF